MKTIPVILALLTCFANVQAQQYDESKVPQYTLPDPLTTAKGLRVNDVRTWETVRRPEILRLFEDNIYGQMPRDFDSIRFAVLREDLQAMDGRARLKETKITVYRNGQSVSINLVLFVPNKAGRPAPAFLLINNRSKTNTDPQRKTKSPFWPAEMAIDSGFAIAAFHVGDLAPDNKDTYMNGVLRLYPRQLQMDNGMKAIGAWAWGAGRVMDYFMTEPLVDAKKVAVVGHSRGGKAALWAAAQDQRFALCVTNCSGNSGAALARRQFGERVKRINTTFPHWFSNNYKKYNDRENELPVDQHMLIGLIAPRPVYATNATKDLWADPKGTFLAMKHAEAVYGLYGLTSALPGSAPGANVSVEVPPLGYHNREGEHDMTLFDWERFIRFAKSGMASK